MKKSSYYNILGQESYAKLHAISMSEAFKNALFDKIEDAYDITLANDAYDDYVKTGKQSSPFSELCKELDL